jgi:hypothetical protein
LGFLAATAPFSGFRLAIKHFPPIPIKKPCARLSPQQRVDIFFAIRERVHPDVLAQDLREFIECLNSNRVDYIIW